MNSQSFLEMRHQHFPYKVYEKFRKLCQSHQHSADVKRSFKGELMETAIAALKQLRELSAAASKKADEVLGLCHSLNIPSVTIYSMAGSEGWYQMQRVFVFTKRTDAADFIWYDSFRTGLSITSLDKKSQMTLEEWDPEADLFTCGSLDGGATNIDPFERERRGHSGI